MMTMLTNSLYYALAKRGYLCEVTANTPSQASIDAGMIFNLVVDISDLSEGGVTESAATLYFTCKDSDIVAEDGITPLFTLELNDITIGNLIYSGERANVEGLSKPTGCIKLGDLGTIIHLINEIFTIMITNHNENPKTENMWGPEGKLNDFGFSLVTISVGDYNTVTTSGRVEGYNTYVRMTHMPTSNIVIACIDEDVLTENKDAFEVLSTSRLTEDKLRDFLMYTLDKKHHYLIDDAANSIQAKVVEDVKRACKNILLPFAQIAMSQKLEIAIGGSGVSDPSVRSEE